MNSAYPPAHAQVDSLSGLLSVPVMRVARRRALPTGIGRTWGPRVVEPYSLRRTNGGHLLLYVVNDRGKPRSYRVDRIAGAEATNEPFSPRHAVEF